MRIANLGGKKHREHPPNGGSRYTNRGNECMPSTLTIRHGNSGLKNTRTGWLTRAGVVSHRNFKKGPKMEDITLAIYTLTMVVALDGLAIVVTILFHK